MNKILSAGEKTNTTREDLKRRRRKNKPNWSSRVLALGKLVFKRLWCLLVVKAARASIITFIPASRKNKKRDGRKNLHDFPVGHEPELPKHVWTDLRNVERRAVGARSYGVRIFKALKK